MVIPAEDETQVVPLHREHAILCVDDEPYVLAALRRTLSREPYDLLTTESALHALEFVQTRKISLVLSDERMAEMSGSELLKDIHACSPATLGIILTGYPFSVRPPVGPREAIRWILVKPWDNGSLIRTLRQLLREQELERKPTRENEGPWKRDLGGES